MGYIIPVAKGIDVPYKSQITILTQFVDNYI